MNEVREVHKVTHSTISHTETFSLGYHYGTQHRKTCVEKHVPYIMQNGVRTTIITAPCQSSVRPSFTYVVVILFSLQDLIQSRTTCTLNERLPNIDVTKMKKRQLVWVTYSIQFESESELLEELPTNRCGA